MIIPVLAAFQILFEILLILMALFLILLVLVQRGRGGGLAGALGGMGGQSAFGAKAGDVFTRITVIAATLWILLCIAAAKCAPSGGSSRLEMGAPTSSEIVPGEKAPAEKGSTTESETESGTTSEKQSQATEGEAAPATQSTNTAAEVDSESSFEEPPASNTESEKQ